MDIQTTFLHDAANLIWQMDQDRLLLCERPSLDIKPIVKEADARYIWNLTEYEVSKIALLLGKTLWTMRKETHVA